VHVLKCVQWAKVPEAGELVLRQVLFCVERRVLSCNVEQSRINQQIVIICDNIIWYIEIEGEIFL